MTINRCAPPEDCEPPVCFAIPSDILAEVAENGSPEDRRAAIRTLSASSSLRGRRSLMRSMLSQTDLGFAQLAMTAQTGQGRTVYDVEHGTSSDLPGERIRGQGDAVCADAAVNEAYDGADLTYRFFKDVFGRDSIDGAGMEMISSVHYGHQFDNAMWNGTQMVYGDGSGRIMAIGSLTKAVDVIGHELSHGLTQMTAGLQYRKQSGALNESFSDVFGTLVKQHSRGETAEEADWLIGEGLLGSALRGQALRSMKEPGHAFELDRQPGHMSKYADLPADGDPRNDNGGVHINSGIPNRAFYLCATTIGGYAWEKAGRIWYVTLTERLRPDSDFTTAAEATVDVAGDLYGAGSLEQRAVRAAWRVVGVL